MSSEQQEIPHSWTWRLHEEYTRIRSEHGQFSGLSQVSFEIDYASNSKLGQWCRSAKIIRISAQLIKEASYEDLLDVLKHEMAHQLADEYFRANNETAHGPAFRQACTILNIPSEASKALEKDPQKEKVIRKLDKLLALGESPNKNEAEMALNKAQEMALRHNIRRCQQNILRPYSLRLVGPVSKRLPSFLGLIANIINEFYFVRTVLKSTPTHQAGVTPHQSDILKQWEIAGSLENLEVAEYVFNFLINQGEHEWRQYKKTNRGVGRYRNAFLWGLYEGFRDKLREERSELQEKHELIYLGDSGLDEFFTKRYPSVRTQVRRVSQKADISSAGAVAGKKISIKPGLRRPRDPNRGRLLNG